MGVDCFASQGTEHESEACSVVNGLVWYFIDVSERVGELGGGVMKGAAACPSALLPLLHCKILLETCCQPAVVPCVWSQLKELLVKCVSDLLDSISQSPLVEPEALRPVLTLLLLYVLPPPPPLTLLAHLASKRRHAHTPPLPSQACTPTRHPLCTHEAHFCRHVLGLLLASHLS